MKGPKLLKKATQRLQKLSYLAGARLVYFFLERSRRDSEDYGKSDDLTVFIVGNSNQLLLCLSLPESTVDEERVFLYHSFRGLPQVEASLSENVYEFKGSTFRKLVEDAWRGNRQVRVWIMHLSPYTFKFLDMAYLYALKRRRGLYFYDDGLSITGSTSTMAEGYVPKGSTVSSWNYAVSELVKSRYIRLEAVGSFNTALRLLEKSAWSLRMDAYSALGTKSTGSAKRLRLVVASKGQNYRLLCDKIYNDADNEYHYIRHYQESKNNEEIESLTVPLKLSIPEIEIIQIAKLYGCTVFIGVTGTALLLIEFALRTEQLKGLEIVFSASAETSALADQEEYLGFRDKMIAYGVIASSSQKSLSIRMLT